MISFNVTFSDTQKYKFRVTWNLKVTCNCNYSSVIFHMLVCFYCSLPTLQVLVVIEKNKVHKNNVNLKLLVLIEKNKDMLIWIYNVYGNEVRLIQSIKVLNMFSFPINILMFYFSPPEIFLRLLKSFLSPFLVSAFQLTHLYH